MLRPIIFLSLIVCGLSATLRDEPDYCSLCPSKSHVACNHNGAFESKCPKDAKMVEITDVLKGDILMFHNKKRNKLAGGGLENYKPACRMATMHWGKGLARVAAYNVKQCEMKHDRCRSTPDFKYSGQNLAMFQTNGPLDVRDMIKNSIQAWFDEYVYANMGYMESYPSSSPKNPIGHFTVMMAEKNVEVGCAIATYTDQESKLNTFLMACNYATTNIVGFPIYNACRKAAMNCTTGKSKTYTNLCSDNEKYEVNTFMKGNVRYQ